MSPRPPTLRIVLMLSGMIAWAAHFGFIYAINAIVCARGLSAAELFGMSVVPTSITLATIVTLVVTLIAMHRAITGRGSFSPAHQSEPSTEFLRYMTVTVGAISLLAILWSAIPVIFTSPCA